jgi:hypothetical protein
MWESVGSTEKILGEYGWHGFSHLPCGVMVTQRPLEALFMVRVHVGQKRRKDTTAVALLLPINVWAAKGVAWKKDRIK